MEVNLYTRQHENSLYEIQNKGSFTNKEIYVALHFRDIAEDFVRKYRKFTEMAEKIVPRPSYADYPVWCSLTKNTCFKAGPGNVVYCLRVPKSQVIYFSSDKWDYVLNDLYIPKDAQDYQDYMDQIQELGVKDQYHFLRGKYVGMFPEIEEKIVDSWTRIFDIDYWNEFKVQGNIWEIKKEWIQHVIYPGEDIYTLTEDMVDDIEDHKF